MKGKVWGLISAVTVMIMCMLAFAGCVESVSIATRDLGEEWRVDYNLTMPTLDGAGDNEASANDTGWYSTLIDNFDGDSLNSDKWVMSPHKKRNTEYWCDNMVTVKDGNAVIGAEKLTDNVCDTCPAEGNFTSGIETLGKLEQAFGYYEARVQVPKATGMWSAFWLQSTSMPQVGNQGEDGSEIDIYESSFYDTDRYNTGHAVHYDGYENYHRVHDRLVETDTNLYEGYHTYALLWTPTHYVFYVNGEATWATDFGGVSKVPAYVRLTSEIRGDVYGPYGQILGVFDQGDDFKVDYVKVYQNTNYLDSIMSPSDFD